MLRNMRSALVAGATGFIGSSLVRRLSNEGLQVCCLVRPGSAGRSRIEHLPGVELLEIENYEGSVLAQKLMGHQTDVVFNLASTGVSPEDRHPQALLAGNLDIIAGLISATASWRLKRFIHIGSCSEYGGTAQGHKLTEEDPLRPCSLYGAAKACSHIYGTAFAMSRNMPFLTLRLFGVFGTGEAPHRLVPHIISHLLRDLPVDLTAGEQVRDLLYVDDAVEALIQSAENDKLLAKACYNVCSGRGIRIRELAEEVVSVMKKPKNLLRFGARPYRADEAMWVVGDNAQFVGHSSWAPKISIQEGVRRMVVESPTP